MKFVVTIKPRTVEEVQHLDVSKFDDIDIIEWRADYLSKDEIMTLAPAVFEKLAGREILFNIKTVENGGHIQLDGPTYVQIIKDIDTFYHPDYIEFEYFTFKEYFNELTEFSNLTLSYYDYEKTPENLMEIFSELTTLAPKVVKIYVTPNQEQDVLDLMNYTRGFKTLNPKQIYATQSLGKLGRLTSLAGDISGSSWSQVSLEKEDETSDLTLSEMIRIKEMLYGD